MTFQIDYGKKHKIYFGFLITICTHDLSMNARCNVCSCSFWYLNTNTVTHKYQAIVGMFSIRTHQTLFTRYWHNFSVLLELKSNIQLTNKNKCNYTNWSREISCNVINNNNMSAAMRLFLNVNLKCEKEINSLIHAVRMCVTVGASKRTV